MTSREISKYCKSIVCEWCKGRITGSAAYCCLDCSFFIHKECAELPVQIQHPFHPKHPLVRTYGSLEDCKACDQISFFDVIIEHLGYSCTQCYYHLDLSCASSILHKEELSHVILHFNHEHHLTFYCVSGASQIKCCMCEHCIRGPDDWNLYGCSDCKFFLHDNCAKLPQEINLPFHEHLLTYCGDYRDDGSRLQCAFCKEHRANGYVCSTCKILIDPRCASCDLMTQHESESSVEGMKHLSHEHPLSYFHSKPMTMIRCSICYKKIKGEFYGCRECRFFTHKSCTELPLVIKHPVHPRHSLTLMPKKDKYQFARIACSLCSDNVSVNNITYRCTISHDDCTFGMETGIDCANAVEIPALDEDGQSPEIQSIAHVHPLTFLDQCKAYKIRCNAYNHKIDDGPAYYCRSNQCQMWLHKSCAEVPKVIEKSPFHPDHSLTVEFDNICYPSCCSFCQKEIEGFVVLCEEEECGFRIDFDCLLRRQTLKNPRHEHDLIYIERSFFEKLKDCHVYGKRCMYDFYHCPKCKFNMHYFCSCLPLKVKSERHVHELTLLEVYLKDDSGDYRCDLCSKIRHPQQGIYHCNICELICHLNVPSQMKLKIKTFADWIKLKRIVDLKGKIAEEEGNLYSAKKNLEAVEGRMKELMAEYTASTEKCSIWTRKGGSYENADL